MTRRRLVTALLIALSVATVAARQQAQRTPEEYAKFLEGAERVSRMQVPRVVGALGLTAGMRVADIGSGSGLFTRPIAAAIAPGTAFAVDIDPALLAIVDRSAREAGLKNVTIVTAALDDPKLPEPVDLAFVCDTLHHIQNQGAWLKRLKTYLKPGGRVAVIDFSDRWPDGHESMRYSVAQLDAWMTDAGLARAASYDWLENSFFIVYR